MTPATADDEPDARAWEGSELGDSLNPDSEAGGDVPTLDEDAVPEPADAIGLPMPLGADELAALIRRVMDQDQAALTALYDALSGRVYACALRITRQVGLAEEAMQDTFWQVWRQAPRFDPARGPALAWVLNIARSRSLDAVRSREREALHQRQRVQQEIEEQASDPLELLQDLRRDSHLHQTLAALDPLKCQLIALAYYRGLTQDEIAAQTGMPLGTVKSHLRRTLAALREALVQDPARGGLGPAA